MYLQQVAVQRGKSTDTEETGEVGGNTAERDSRAMVPEAPATNAAYVATAT